MSSASEYTQPIRIALHTRSATDSDGALTTQESRLRPSVAEMPGLHLARTFRDPATSGLTLDRPALHDLLAAAAAHEIDVAMVTSRDRLSRSPRDLAHLRDVLASHGVRVTTPVEERKPAFTALIQQFSALSAS